MCTVARYRTLARAGLVPHAERCSLELPYIVFIAGPYFEPSHLTLLFATFVCIATLESAAEASWDVCSTPSISLGVGAWLPERAVDAAFPHAFCVVFGELPYPISGDIGDSGWPAKGCFCEKIACGCWC
jgi:hypothetical protein